MNGMDRNTCRDMATGFYTTVHYKNMAVYAHDQTPIGFGVGPPTKAQPIPKVQLFPAYNEIDYTGEHPYFKTLIVVNGELQFVGYEDINTNLQLCILHTPYRIRVYDWLIPNQSRATYVSLGRNYTEQCFKNFDYSYSNRELMVNYKDFTNIQSE